MLILIVPAAAIAFAALVLLAYGTWLWWSYRGARRATGRRALLTVSGHALYLAQLGAYACAGELILTFFVGLVVYGALTDTGGGHACEHGQCTAPFLHHVAPSLAPYNMVLAVICSILVTDIALITACSAIRRRGCRGS